MLFIGSGLIINWAFHFLNSYLWVTNPNLPILQIMDFRPFLIGSGFIFACVIIYKNLKQPAVKFVSERAETQPTLIEIEAGFQILEKIKSYMQDKKPYLDPNFNLSELAISVGYKPHIVSKVLNKCQKQNFHNFINEYRVNECQQMLASTAYLEKNITQIMFMSGFNTKSVFNTMFKKMSGKTPRAYRQAFLQQSYKSPEPTMSSSSKM
ncbi:AraC family transcriptional regulator [uncultured Algibacter sp.]|uniref:helix-turn-helix domain-containing protein n=1 Tax=uncultured Algibacter sp. TaxID=298659 RepID=UPI00262ECF12|nr:AraC family transcriptional regulator [uncultured Algibacter sp.]